MKIADQIQADQILLLGDLYYNGARNDPPKDYAPKKVVSLLNEHAEKIIAVKGNCESEVDQMVSSFPINEQATIFAFGKKIFLTHGHHFSFTSLPNNPGDVFLQGHTHISVLEKKENLNIFKWRRGLHFFINLTKQISSKTDIISYQNFQN